MRGLRFDRKVGEGLKCTGGQCYKLSFIIITAETLLGVLISLVWWSGLGNVIPVTSIRSSEMRPASAGESEIVVATNPMDCQR